MSNLPVEELKKIRDDAHIAAYAARTAAYDADAAWDVADAAYEAALADVVIKESR